MSLLELDDDTQLLRQHPRAQGRLAHGRGGRNRDPHRRQRRGQDDDAALDLGPSASAQGGKVLLNGKDITKLAPHLVHKEGLGLVPEGRGIFPRLTVLENLEMGAYPGQGQGRDHSAA